MADPVQLLSERFIAAIRAALPALEGELDPQITPNKNPALGDFQCNAALALSKRAGAKPRDLAQALVKLVKIDDLCEPLTDASIAGPGFINLRLRPDALTNALAAMDRPDLGLAPVEKPQTIVVDLFGVNLAKQMHVGHLRSTIIGDTLANTFARLGHTVIRQNHVGDWGLPIAMVTARLARLAVAGKVDLANLTLDQLDEAYKAAKLEADADERGLAAVHKFGLGPKALAELEEQVAGALEKDRAACETLVKLQAHEPATFAVWKAIATTTMRECLAVCARLKTDITDAHSAGESSYSEELAPLVADLVARNVATESDGALVVRCEGIEEPCIVRKSDGGFLYATTDLAAIRRRVQKLGASRVIYVVDIRQSLHFRQVFQAARQAGYARTASGENASLEHAAFGTILGEDGRPFKSRSGENVKLAFLLQEAVERAMREVQSRSRDLSEAEQRAIAEAVGIAAMKYADLSGDRVKDYVFSLDRMVAFEGNTGPYLQYALVRIRSIFRKAAERGIALPTGADTFAVTEPAEKALALALLKYPGVVRSVGESLEPHRLCGYLYDLAGAFSSFFDACPVLAAERDEVRAARLRLCDLTARVLADGFRVLGLPVVERM
jgi:arginyl-tRNA synthetase